MKSPREKFPRGKPRPLPAAVWALPRGQPSGPVRPSDVWPTSVPPPPEAHESRADQFGHFGIPGPQKLCEVRVRCCSRTLSFGVKSYAAMDNQRGVSRSAWVVQVRRRPTAPHRAGELRLLPRLPWAGAWAASSWELPRRKPREHCPTAAADRLSSSWARV